jgi:hypothetical protein
MRISYQNRTVGGPSLDARKAPTIAWEKLDHCLDHVERRRRRRLADELATSEHCAEVAVAKTDPTVLLRGGRRLDTDFRVTLSQSRAAATANASR